MKSGPRNLNIEGVIGANGDRKAGRFVFAALRMTSADSRLTKPLIQAIVVRPVIGAG